MLTKLLKTDEKQYLPIHMTDQLNQLTTLHVRDWLQKLAASSTENSVPPTGAPNAADTPEAAPPDTKSRIS